MRRFFLYPGSHDKITDCLLAGARMPRRLSPRTGGRCVGLGRRRPAGYQTGRVACVARHSQAGEAWRRSTASGPTALLPRFGSDVRRRPSGPAQLCWARSRQFSSARIAAKIVPRLDRRIAEPPGHDPGPFCVNPRRRPWFGRTSAAHGTCRVRAVLPAPHDSLDPRRAVPHRSTPFHPKVWTGRKELSLRLSRAERGGALSLSLSRAERDGSRGVAGGGCGLGAPRAARALGDATGLQAP